MDDNPIFYVFFALGWIIFLNVLGYIFFDKKGPLG